MVRLFNGQTDGRTDKNNPTQTAFIPFLIMEWQESVDNQANPCLDQAEKFAEVIVLFVLFVGKFNFPMTPHSVGQFHERERSYMSYISPYTFRNLATKGLNLDLQALKTGKHFLSSIEKKNMFHGAFGAFGEPII